MNLLNSINNSMKQIEGTLECVPAELKHWTADIVQEPISSWKNAASINYKTFIILKSLLVFLFLILAKSHMTIKCYTFNISIVFGMIRKYGHKLAKYLIYSAAPKHLKHLNWFLEQALRQFFYGALIDSTSISFLI